MSRADPGHRSPHQLHPIESSALGARRERIFLVLAGVFIGAMAMLNILGVTKFIELGPFELAVGVLPYPLTFLCTDLISELYGRSRATAVVITGLLVNVLVLAFIWAGDRAEPIEFRTPLQRIITLDTIDIRDANGEAIIDPASGARLVRPARVVEREGAVDLEAIEQVAIAPDAVGAHLLVDGETGRPLLREETLFGRLARATRQAMLASMVAYLVAQLVDVWLFHFWRRLTKGRHLWLRNNGSTLVSQLVDTICVVGITFWGAISAGEVGADQVLRWIAGGYAFKFAVALLDTVPFYLGVSFLRRYLEIDPDEEFRPT